MIDPTDLQILKLLQENARLSNAEIARRIGMAPSGTFERLRRLEERGVIQGYAPRLDAKAVGLGLLAFVFVRAEELPGQTVTGDALARIPQVLEVHHIAGEDCYLVKARVADTDALGRLLRDRFGAIPSVRSTRTTIVLDTVKEEGCLPLAEPAEEDEGE